MSDHTKIIIIVKGGVVTSVLANDHVEVHIADCDLPKEEALEEAAKKLVPDQILSIDDARVLAITEENF